MPVLKTAIGKTWWTDGIYYQVSTLTREKLPMNGDEHDLDLLDLAAWLQVVDMNWNDHFKPKLQRQVRTWTIEPRMLASPSPISVGPISTMTTPIATSIRFAGC